MVLGIDLGTTNSVVAYVDEKGEPRAVYNAEGTTTTPSVVYFESEDKVLVGQIAKEYMGTAPDRVVSKAKNSIGKKTDKKIEVPALNASYYPQEISSFVLRKLVKDAESFLGKKGEITDVVVTVPAYFTDAQRKATNEAVRLAGLNLIANLNEPTAAAIAYAHDHGLKKSNTLVFDLGGGTFDVTILHINDSNVEVRSTEGLSNSRDVGGCFFDEKLVEYVCDKVDDQLGIDLEDEYYDIYSGLFEQVEKAKKRVCANRTKTVIPVNVGGNRIQVEITYDYLISSIVKKAYDKIENAVKVAISNAGFGSPEEIDQVIMVGGSSRIPYIEEKLTQLMGKEPLRVVNPDEVVALGAAIQADRLSRHEDDKVKDVCSHGYGFLRYSPQSEKLSNVIAIRNNSQLPASAKLESYAFAQDGQKVLNLTLTEGNYEEVGTAVTVKEARIPLPKGIKKGMKYEMQYLVDKRQTITVKLTIPELGKSASVSSGEGNEDPESMAERDAVDARRQELMKVSVG